MRVKCEFIIFPGKFCLYDVQTKMVIASGSENNDTIQGLRMGRAGQHFDLFHSISDRVKAVTTQHIVYACRM